MTCSATVSNAVGLSYNLLVTDGLGNTLVQPAGFITANPQTIQGIFTATYAGGANTNAYFAVTGLTAETLAPSLTVTAAPPPPPPPPPYVAPPPQVAPSYGSFVFSPAGPVVAGTSVTCSATVSNAVGLSYNLLVTDGLGNTLVQPAGFITANPQTIQGIFTATYAGGANTNAYFDVTGLNTETLAPSLTVTAAPT